MPTGPGSKPSLLNVFSAGSPGAAFHSYQQHTPQDLKKVKRAQEIVLKKIIPKVGFEESDKELSFLDFLKSKLGLIGYEISRDTDTSAPTFKYTGEQAEDKTLSTSLTVLFMACGDLLEMKTSNITGYMSEERLQLQNISNILYSFLTCRDFAFERACLGNFLFSEEVFNHDLTISEVVSALNGILVMRSEICIKDSRLSLQDRQVYFSLMELISLNPQGPFSPQSVERFKRFGCKTENAKKFLDLLLLIKRHSEDFNLETSCKSFFAVTHQRSLRISASQQTEEQAEKLRSFGFPVFNFGPAFKDARHQDDEVTLDWHKSLGETIVTSQAHYMTNCIEIADSIRTHLNDYHSKYRGNIRDILTPLTSLAGLRRTPGARFDGLPSLHQVVDQMDRIYATEALQPLTLIECIEKDFAQINERALSGGGLQETEQQTLRVTDNYQLLDRIRRNMDTLSSQIETYLQDHSDGLIETFYDQLFIHFQRLAQHQRKQIPPGGKNSPAAIRIESTLACNTNAVNKDRASNLPTLRNNLKQIKGAFSLLMSCIERHLMSYQTFLEMEIKILNPTKPLGWRPSYADTVELLDQIDARLHPQIDATPKEGVGALESVNEEVEDLSEELEEIALDDLTELPEEVEETPFDIKSFHIYMKQSTRGLQLKLKELIPENHPEPWVLKAKSAECLYHTELAMQNYQCLIDCYNRGEYSSIRLYVPMLLLDMHVATEAFLTLVAAKNNPKQPAAKAHGLVELSKISGIEKNIQQIRFFKQFDLANFTSRFPMYTLSETKIRDRNLTHSLIDRSIHTPKELSGELKSLSVHFQTLCNLILPESPSKPRLLEGIETLGNVGAPQKSTKRKPLKDDSQRKLNALIQQINEILERPHAAQERVHLEEALYLLEQVKLARAARHHAQDDQLVFSHLRSELLLEKALEQIFIYMHTKEHQTLFVSHDFEQYLDKLTLPDAVRKKRAFIKEINLGNAHHYLSMKNPKSHQHEYYKQVFRAQRSRMGTEAGFDSPGMRAYPDLQEHDRRQQELMTIVSQLLVCCK